MEVRLEGFLRAECFFVSGQLVLADGQLGAWLAHRGLVPEGAEVSVEPAGDGNINWVRRARTADGRSLVVKQARPALERFPEYSAPTERIVVEHAFFELASKLPEGEICPRIVDFDECERVLVMEDLTGAERLDAALARAGADAAEVRDAAARLGRFLGAVHGATAGDPSLAERFRNDAMRDLHGAHIFELPLRENDFPLPDPLRAEADRLRADAGLVAIADRLHARYREPRGALLHGDVQAGNVLLADAGPKLLDAEIAHVGDPAFDLGMLIAHLLLPAAAAGGPARAREAIAAADAAYRARLGGALDVAFAEAARYAGIEMLRRTIGAARVPCVEDPEAGLAVLRHAVAWLREPPVRP
jgi:5-methylthioribose kinase